MQFQKNSLPYLNRLKREIQTQEQTQELRLPDGMADAGSVLGAWGQVILRSKEWRTGSAGVSGGVMVWVLYAPEDGGAPQTVETWIPFQCKCDLPDTGRDGMLGVCVLLSGLDARMISVRKLLVRAGIRIQMEAMLPDTLELPEPPELPEDVQLLQNTYTVRFPMEAGEKPFTVEEELTIPASMPKPEQIVAYRFVPDVTDSKVMAGRGVFRGTGAFRLLYQTEDGQLQTWDLELPYSQFTDLEREYGEEAQICFTPMLTALELEKMEDGRLHISAGVTCQYVVSDSAELHLTEDAYSPVRELTLKTEQTRIPMILEQQDRILSAQQSGEVPGNVLMEATFLAEQPRCFKEEDGNGAVEVSGQFQMLCKDENGVLQSTALRWSDSVQVMTDRDSRIDATLLPVGFSAGSVNMGQGSGQSELRLRTTVLAERILPVITELELGEKKERSPDRPSLILRKAGEDSLWNIAKSCGSTVEAIEKANGGKTETGDFLLIPVI